MSLNQVACGKNAPEEFHVIIEIPMNADPIKYEVDKETGAVFVDRFMTAAMRYPVNYGYVPQTLAGDGDPVDVLVVTPYPVMTGAVILCRPIGILQMQDEAGEDAKVLAVPVKKLFPLYENWSKPDDIGAINLQMITHFFEHYKDLEKGKWVKVLGWGDIEAAKKEIQQGLLNYQKHES